jgi:hypothetical protein
MKPNPLNYKTQAGLINALNRASEQCMSVKLAWWYCSAQYALVKKFGWDEKSAAKFVVGFKPTKSIYRASS